MLHLVLFLIFAALCVGGAVNLLVQRHPINSALSLVLVTGSLALIYLLLGAEFVRAKAETRPKSQEAEVKKNTANAEARRQKKRNRR
jgi:high-affinity K+ transport system ATPase subunit B